MDPYFAGLALASVLLHAGRNTFVKVAGDRLVAIATISLGFAVTEQRWFRFAESPIGDRGVLSR